MSVLAGSIDRRSPMCLWIFEELSSFVLGCVERGSMYMCVCMCVRMLYLLHSFCSALAPLQHTSNYASNTVHELLFSVNFNVDM